MYLHSHEVVEASRAVVVRNEMLATLRPELFEQLRPFLKVVELRRRAIIGEEGRPVEAVHFIESGVISRFPRTYTDGSIEVAIVGRFGFVGVSVVLGTMTALQRAVVQIPGRSLRIAASDLVKVMEEYPEVRAHLLKYVHSLMNQQAHISLCNSKHDIEKRSARWLLLAHDRMDGDELPVTHELLARMLGVRRPGVTEALARLEAAGIVSRARGVLKIVDRNALRASACSCYRMISDRFTAQSAQPHFVHDISGL